MKKPLILFFAFLAVIAPSFAQAPTVTSCTPESFAQGSTVWLWISGSNFEPGAIVTIEGDGISHNYEFITTESSTRINSLGITISNDASTGPRNVIVTNPDGGIGTGEALFTVLPGERSTYYVRTNGSDSNDGSANTPFRTITKASKVAVPGSTIEVGAGTFSAGEVFPIQLQQNVTLRGAGRNYTLIDASNASIPPTAGIPQVLAHWGGTIESVAITGVPTSGMGVVAHGGEGNFATIKNCLIYNDTLGADTSGVYFHDFTARVLNTIVYNMGDRGMGFRGNSSATVENATVTNCNLGIGTGNTSQLQVKNSILAGNDNGLRADDNSSIDSNYNDVYSKITNYSNASAGTNDISRDPALNADFSLKATSPCIRAGENGVDLGAIPFTGTRRNIIYVDDNLVDFPNADFTTISTACATATSGDTIIVATGEYTSAKGETFPITVPTGVMLQGSGGIGADSSTTGKTVIVGTYGQPTSSEVVRLSNNSTLEGVMIKGVGSSLGDFGIAVRDVTNAEIKKCFLDGENKTGRMGIWLGGWSAPASARISNSIVTGFGGDGIFLLLNATAEATNVTITANHIGISSHDNPGTKIIVKNSIITSNESLGLYAGNLGTIESSYNDVWGNEDGNYMATATGEGDISVDPLFINPTTKNFRLQSTAEVEGSFTHSNNTSPCIDAGDPSSDYSGEVRGDYFNGNRANMGAFGNTEWFEPTPPAVPTTTTTTTTSTSTTTTPTSTSTTVTSTTATTSTIITTTTTTTISTVVAPPAVSITPPEAAGQAATLTLDFQASMSGNYILIIEEAGPPPEVLLEKRIDLSGEKKISAILITNFGVKLSTGEYRYKIIDSKTGRQIQAGSFLVP